MCWLPPRNSLSLPVGSSCEWPLGVQGHRDPPCSLQTFIEWLSWLAQMQGANNWPMEQLFPSLVKWFNEFTKVTYKKYGCLLGIYITKKSHIPKGVMTHRSCTPRTPYPVCRQLQEELSPAVAFCLYHCRKRPWESWNNWVFWVFSVSSASWGAGVAPHSKTEGVHLEEMYPAPCCSSLSVTWQKHPGLHWQLHGAGASPHNLL